MRAAKSTSCSENNTDKSILYEEEYKPFWLPLLVFTFPIMPLFWNYHVRITDDELSFGYSSDMTTKLVKNRKTAIKEATSLFDKTWWQGYGIKYQPNPNRGIFGRWDRLYVANNGGAVKVVVEDDVAKTGGDNDTTTYFFTAEDPQKVCDILNKK